MVKIVVQDGIAVVGNVIIRKWLPLLGIKQTAQLVLGTAVIPNDVERAHQGLGTFVHLQLDRQLVLYAPVVIDHVARDLDFSKALCPVKRLQSPDVTRQQRLAVAAVG